MGTLSLDGFGQVLDPIWKKCVSGSEMQKEANMKDGPSQTQEASGKHAVKSPWKQMSFTAFKPLEIRKKNGTRWQRQKLQCQYGGRQISFPAGSPYCQKSSLHGDSNLKIDASGLHSWKVGSLKANACQRGAEGIGNSWLLLLRGKNNLPAGLSSSHKVWSRQNLTWDTVEQLPKANSSFGFTLHWWFLWAVTNLSEDLGMIWKRWFLSSHLNTKIRYESHPEGEQLLR